MESSWGLPRFASWYSWRVQSFYIEAQNPELTEGGGIGCGFNERILQTFHLLQTIVAEMGTNDLPEEISLADSVISFEFL